MTFGLEVKVEVAVWSVHVTITVCTHTCIYFTVTQKFEVKTALLFHEKTNLNITVLFTVIKNIFTAKNSKI